ncbi:hypothetical protein HYT26_00030 [Candidatus Pacearchaeota archaeon]|nr:hypothetical protein [Candidatus Pacearchaeota archaeon]
MTERIEDFKEFYHVDISTQINNKWKNNSVLGIVKDSRRYSILIKSRDKEILKKRFISEETTRANKKHNKKVIAIIYSYILYKALCDFKEARPLLLCRDVRPENFVINYLRKICNFYKNNDIFNREIKFRKKTEFDVKEKLPKSMAGKYTRKVYQGKIKPDKTLSDLEIEELVNLISKII